LAWTEESLGHLFPTAVDGTGKPVWELFASPIPATGVARFDAQYFRANTSLSDRYMTCYPGSLKYRLPAAADCFDNLFLAGDWTQNNICIGSLEGAVLSGRMAARAILGMDYALYGELDPMPWGRADAGVSAS
jgi:hypothetical protein